MLRFTLTEQQTDQVLNALGQLPFLQVNGLINTLLKQAQSQQQEQQQPQQAVGEPAPAVLPNGAYNGPPVAVANS